MDNINFSLLLKCQPDHLPIHCAVQNKRYPFKRWVAGSVDKATLHARTTVV